MKCSICDKEEKGYGNNANPLNSGRCCDECNLKFVIPRRMLCLKNDNIEEDPQPDKEEETKLVDIDFEEEPPWDNPEGKYKCECDDEIVGQMCLIGEHGGAYGYGSISECEHCNNNIPCPHTTVRHTLCVYRDYDWDSDPNGLLD